MANLVQETELQRLQLKPDEEVIIKAFCNPKSPTCGNQSLSYKQARSVKESALTVIASKFFQRTKIKDAVTAYQNFFQQKIERTEQGARDRELAFLMQVRESLIIRNTDTNKISSNDWPSVLNCTEKICKIENILNDTLKIDVGFQGLLGQLADGERPLLTDAVQDRLKRLGKPSQKHTETDVIDAQFVAQDNAEGVQDQQQADNPPEFPDYA